MNTYKIFEFSSIITYSEFKVKVKVKIMQQRPSFLETYGLASFSNVLMEKIIFYHNFIIILCPKISSHHILLSYLMFINTSRFKWSLFNNMKKILWFPLWNPHSRFKTLLKTMHCNAMKVPDNNTENCIRYLEYFPNGEKM